MLRQGRFKFEFPSNLYKAFIRLFVEMLKC